MAILERGESAMSECVMCSQEIKTNKPVVIFTDTLFNPNGRWSEHLNRDTLCSVECLIQLLQDDDGQIIEPYSISAGLDYPGIGPLHAHLHDSLRARYISATDEEALNAALLLTQKEGIIPALESAHALAVLEKIEFNKNDVVVLNLSGRGDKDMDTYLNHFGL